MIAESVIIATTDGEWIFAGKWAVVLLPIMLIGLGISLAVALLRSRAARTTPSKDQKSPAESRERRGPKAASGSRGRSRDKRS